MTELTISKAAKNAGVGVETIRFYERKGLIEQPPKPLDNGFRVYPEETVQRVRFIRQAQEIGFSLREIEELLSLRADPIGPRRIDRSLPGPGRATCVLDHGIPRCSN